MAKTTKTWAEQFEASYRRWLKADPDNCEEPFGLEDALSSAGWAEDKATDGLWDFYARERARQAIEAAWRDREAGVAAETESPVERAMLVALLVAGGKMGGACLRGVRNGKPANVFHGHDQGETVASDLGGGPEYFTIQPQAQIGKYRADFLVTYHDLSKTYWERSGERDSLAPFSLVVEVDGHDFHERTKDQARRDKKRDRDIQNLGFMVLRFTGSDVWADPLKCATEVLRIARRQWAAKWEPQFLKYYQDED